MKNIFYKLLLIFFLFSFVSKSIFAARTPWISPKIDVNYEVPIVVYHSFGPALTLKEGKTRKHYRVTEAMFEKQMEYLYENNYHPITFANYIASIRDKTSLPSNSVVLTFDDGWKTQYRYAVPVLEKFKFTATFFIVANYVNDSRNEYMSWDDLKYLVAHGFDIESHSKNHPMLTRIKPIELADELTGSKKTLEEKLNIKVTAIAYPDYMQNLIVRNATEKAGYLGARAGWGIFKNGLDHIYELKSKEAVSNGNPFLSKRLPDLP